MLPRLLGKVGGLHLSRPQRGVHISTSLLRILEPGAAAAAGMTFSGPQGWVNRFRPLSHFKVLVPPRKAVNELLACPSTVTPPVSPALTPACPCTYSVALQV